MFDEEALKTIQFILQQAPQPVRLVAVTKNADLKTTQSLVDAGVEVIGENRIEAAEEKFLHLPKVEKHFIGQIQSKKIRRIVELFDVIQSVGSNKHLLKIDQIAKNLGKKISVFLQFNLSALLEAGISKESQKGGYSVDELEDVKKALKQIQFIQVIGLMGMASHTSSESVIRHQFKTLRQLRDELQKKFPSITELSMGMSDDYQTAIEEGATVVRIGRGILD